VDEDDDEEIKASASGDGSPSQEQTTPTNQARGPQNDYISAAPGLPEKRDFEAEVKQQKMVMKEKIEAARQRELEQGARMEATKKERIVKPLLGLPPLPTRDKKAVNDSAWDSDLEIDPPLAPKRSQPGQPADSPPLKLQKLDLPQPECATPAASKEGLRSRDQTPALPAVQTRIKERRPLLKDILGPKLLNRSMRLPPNSMSIKPDNVKRSSNSLSSSFSAAGSLSSFLDLRGSKFKSAVNPGVPQSTTFEVESDPIQDSQTLSGESSSTVEVLSTPRSFSSRTHQTSACLEPVSALSTIIADEALMSNHALIRILDENAEKNLTTIYRDLRGQPDLILNPLTCVVYTTAQALTQRSLPGQDAAAEDGGVRSRLKSLLNCYDTVFALITLPVGTVTTVSEAQASTMAAFASFCSSVSGLQGRQKVCPIWVFIQNPPEDRHSLDPICAWTWKLIRQHAFRNKSVVASNTYPHRTNVEPVMLIQEISVWELLLVKAGMNPMAAQLVLGMLKRPDDETQMSQDDVGAVFSPSYQSLFGLRLFVSMSSPQRHKLFDDIVGRRCVERANRLLESGWQPCT
jgi:hypothetical protein